MHFKLRHGQHKKHFLLNETTKSHTLRNFLFQRFYLYDWGAESSVIIALRFLVRPRLILTANPLFVLFILLLLHLIIQFYPLLLWLFSLFLYWTSSFICVLFAPFPPWIHKLMKLLLGCEVSAEVRHSMSSISTFTTASYRASLQYQNKLTSA